MLTTDDPPMDGARPGQDVSAYRITHTPSSLRGYRPGATGSNQGNRPPAPGGFGVSK